LRIIETTYCIDPNQILNSDKKTTSWVFQTRASQIQDGERLPAWKNRKKSAYLSNGLIDRREIWKGDAI